MLSFLSAYMTPDAASVAKAKLAPKYIIEQPLRLLCKIASRSEEVPIIFLESKNARS